MTDDDLTTAYILGVEHIRGKMHKMADEIERLRAENETLRRDVKTAVMGDSAELRDVKRENEKLRAALVVEGQSSEKENRRKRAYYNEVITAEKVISELRAENERLRDVLKPFADYSDCLNEEEVETGNLAKDYDNQPVKIHYLRAAAAAIRESGE